MTEKFLAIYDFPFHTDVNWAYAVDTPDAQGIINRAESDKAKCFTPLSAHFIVQENDTQKSLPGMVFLAHEVYTKEVVADYFSTGQEICHLLGFAKDSNLEALCNTKAQKRFSAERRSFVKSMLNVTEPEIAILTIGNGMSRAFRYDGFDPKQDAALRKTKTNAGLIVLEPALRHG